LSRPELTNETDVLAAGFQFDIAPDVVLTAAALLVAMVAAGAVRDETELDGLLNEIGQLSRYWARQIKKFDDDEVMQ
jgi:hypothetical protein